MRIKMHQTLDATAAILLVVGLLACPSSVMAKQVYFNDFETSIGAEWSITGGGGTLGIDNAGGGPGLKFLGLADSLPDGGFGNNIVTLTLSLPAHSKVTVSFDYYGIRSLDGGFNCCGPDKFVFNIGSFTRTTTTGGPTQAFPNFLELGGTPSDNPPFSGNNGFLGPLQNAASYPMSFTVPHTSSTHCQLQHERVTGSIRRGLGY